MSLEPSNFLRFRCRLESADGRDAHRAFTGVYYPRWRALYIDEIKEITGKVKLAPCLPFDVYPTPAGDYYFTEDLRVGATLRFATTGHSPDVAPKNFVITEIDDSKLRSTTENGLPKLDNTRQLPERVFQLLLRVRDAFGARCGDLSLKSIGRRFRIMDDSGNRLVSKPEFVKAIKEVRLAISDADINDVFAAFDANADGAIDYEELLNVLRGPMSERRKLAVQSAFAKLDQDKDGHISLRELCSKYQASRHPEVLAGRLTEGQVISAFGAIWDTREKNGLISFAEFCDYYNGVSASIETDELFVQTVETAWKL